MGSKPDRLNTTLFYASEVYDCLISVPFHAAVALRFIEYYNTTIQFQSALAHLKNPPDGYQQPGVDLLAGLERIKGNVVSGYYNNQYSFEVDVQRLIYAAHDSHLILDADSQDAGWAGWAWQLSPIVSVNGNTTVNFFTQFAAKQSVGMLEPHADWNELMWHPAEAVLGPNTGYNAFTGAATFYPGDDLNVTLANGSTLDLPWLALCLNTMDTGTLATGGDFYNYFVLGQTPASLPPIPEPDDNDLEEDEYDDDKSPPKSCVPTFSPRKSGAKNFTMAVQDFVDRASAANLSRIIIDLQQNAGGEAGLAIDAFRCLFPAVGTPFTGSRRRNHPLADKLGDVMAPRLNADTGANFQNWSEYFGPRTYKGDQFSLTEQYDLENSVFDEESFGVVPFGFNDSTVHTNNWKPEDVLILTDVKCSLACSLFVGFATQIGVRTVVADGRPEKGPMQSASGSRGARGYFSITLNHSFRMAGSVDATGEANATFPEVPSNMELRDTGIIRPQASLGEEPVPLQFRYEAADCRIFYALKNVLNMTQLWHDVAAAGFDNLTLCVEGSRGSSTPKPPPRRLGTTAFAGAEWFTNVSPSTLSAIELEDPTITDGDLLALSAIRDCSSNRLCSRDSPCQTIIVTCKKGGSQVTSRMCLPKCNTTDDCVRRDERDPATETNLKCVNKVKADVKANGKLKEDRNVDLRRTKLQTESGYCKPRKGTAASGCTA
ncbi:peptidase S41 family protein [Podospora didyma]|uniref:Peptidase S41 family protein n=1 Tax=Podospora didyma TaxID=330526 RepID=A0AAE0N5Z1_9PEZI|nr:peptidase S41 family protein [Podospora didyma]